MTQTIATVDPVLKKKKMMTKGVSDSEIVQSPKELSHTRIFLEIKFLKITLGRERFVAVRAWNGVRFYCRNKRIDK